MEIVLALEEVVLAKVVLAVEISSLVRKCRVGFGEAMRREC